MQGYAIVFKVNDTPRPQNVGKVTLLLNRVKDKNQL